MSVAVSLVSAQAGGRALSYRCIPAGPGSNMRGISGQALFAAPSAHRLQQRAEHRRFELCAGYGGVVRAEEQGERPSQHNVVTVHVNDDDLTFTSDAPAHAILAHLEVIAGPGILVRAGDFYSPLKDEKVPAGDYAFRTGESKAVVGTREQAAVSQELQAMRAEIAKMASEAPSLGELWKNWVVVGGYFPATWGPPALRVVGTILEKDLDFLDSVLGAAKDSLGPFVVVR
ncbi:hypothetical protein KFL_001370270 [Klebsormidium nitens]|uniref:Uncharacterized protein n=1 Tax=Klebsormidium nitens TaxID=105231 RepID=A0A1Y1I326_KLENI|nr:hypothetical protein KFL_001370270 [Klebsormidium nitens]|eukprot:GAQ83157.1 hypothetical protein KFL_001370270 [Klebsormidium nitens]